MTHYLFLLLWIGPIIAGIYRLSIGRQLPQSRFEYENFHPDVDRTFANGALWITLAAALLGTFLFTAANVAK